MKLGFFDDYRLGVVNGGSIIGIDQIVQSKPSDSPQARMNDLISQWDTLKPIITNEIRNIGGTPLEQVRIRAPLPRPNYIVCMAVNYLEFGTRPMPEIDAFLKAPDSVIGDGDTIHLDPRCQASIFHHEAELGVVMGRPAKAISANDAMEYVFGYTGFIDVSGRVRIRGAQSFYQTKSWPTFGPMGPFIVTKDEIPDPHNIAIQITNSGEPRQAFNTDDMAHKIPACIEFATHITPLGPGDLISTGTNHQGLGAIQDGDEITLEVQNIGKIHLRVEDPLKREWPRGIDQETAERMQGSNSGNP